MSDNMERDKAELLTAKERKEEEEMKRELLDMKMYETWYTYRDMKQILGFINESKDMANMANDEKNVQKELLQSSNDCTSETIPKTNLAQELEIQEHDNTTRPIHSHRLNHASPILDRISTHSRSSPEPASTAADSRNSGYRSKNLDSDDMFDRLHDNLNIRDSYSHNMNRYISLKTKNTSQDSHSMHSTETKMDTYSERDQKLERWQINPLDSCVSENDVLLQQPDQLLVQDCMPCKLCKDAQTSEMLEKLLLVLNIHLKETAELWHSWHRTTDTKFQWGSPIQVELSKDDLDKKSLTDIMHEESKVERTNKNERPNKRTSTLAFSSPNTRHSSSDEDEKVVKKKKIQPNGQSKKILRFHSEAPVDKNEKNQSLTNKNINKHFDNVETENLKMEHQEEECLSPKVLSSYTRRITSPNPRKNIDKKKKNNTPTNISNKEQGAISLIPKEKNNTLTDQEIVIELEKNNTSDSIKITPENIEIKPLPIRGLSQRIKNECMILERIQKEKQKKMKIEKEEVQKKESEEKRKREEFYRKQIEERQQREKQREEKEKSREEKSKKWNSIVDMKFRRKVGEEGKEILRGLCEQTENRISEVIEEDKLLQDSGNSVAKGLEMVKNDLTNNINCPICNQSFSSDKIEAHAAGCEQYLTDNENESANLFRECTSTEIDNILNSPVRCYQPISEQIDSEIDYRAQFSSNSRARIHSNKRRRH